MMLSVFFYTLYNIVDAFWVSKVSDAAIAAVSISQITLFLMISLGFGITIGSGVVMSMDIGAGNRQGAERVLGQSFVLTTILGVFFTVFSLLFRETLLVLSGATGAVLPLAIDYFTITAAGSVPFFILITIMFAFNAQGDTFTLTKLFAVSTLVNMIVDPLLIFGTGPLPAMGISGAAVSTVISQLVFIGIALYSLSRPTRSICFHWRNLTCHWHSVRQVLKIGIPAALTQVINPIGVAALTYLTGYYFAEVGTVAFSLGFRVEFFAYLPAVGFGFGAMAMMGQNIGAGQFKRAEEIYQLALRYGVSLAFVFGLLVAVFARPIIAVFSTDPTVVQYSLGYMRTVSLTYCFLAAMMIEANAFQSIGHSWPGFWTVVIRFGVVAIPVSLLLINVFDFSIMAVWLGLVGGNVAAAVVGYFWFMHTFKAVDTDEVSTVVHAT